MALQKQYSVKLYDQDGTTLKKIVAPNEVKNFPAFRDRINGGQGECVLDLDLPWDNFGEGTDIDFMHIGKVYEHDADNPRGRLIYAGFLSRYEPYIQSGGIEGVRVTLLGLISLLGFSYYKNGSNFSVTHTSVDPNAIARAVIDHFNTIYGGALLSWTAGSTPVVGTNVTFTFTDQRWLDAITKTCQLAGTDWWYHVDETGLFSMKQKPGTASHTFTIGKDVESISAKKDSEGVINDVQVRRSGGTATNYSDSGSQAAFGTGNPATGKRSKIVSDTSISDATTADQRGNKEIADNEDEKIRVSAKINVKYDIESVKIGQTCKFRNFRKASSFFSDNMLIVGLAYSGEYVSLELEEQNEDFGRELESYVNAEGAAT